MKALTSYLYSFEELIRGNFLYIDKTEYVWNLVKCNNSGYFLSRPRRFGKSLLLSTLKAVFEGKRELFKGLAIYDKPYDWQTYPIIHLDMANCSAHTPDELREFCVLMLANIAQQYGVTVPITTSQLSMGFELLVKALADTQGKVVILIDEYDKPILENLTNPNREAIRDALAEFYSTVKKVNSQERFVFVTGVTKFCHVSLFSNLNNLVDLSMHEDYATMLGYTQEELEANFGDWLAEAEQRNALPHDQFMDEVKNWYDGYRFHPNATKVYNPVSLASFFINHGDFRNYWFTTGTTTALLKLMKEQNFNLPEALENSVLPNFFETFELDHINLKMLMYQTGYLTIAQTIQVKIPYTNISNSEYLLTFPNYEVKRSFDEHLLEYYTNVKTDQSLRLISQQTTMSKSTK